MNRNFALALLASTALLPVKANAQQLPSGGQVAAGNATINAPSGGAMAITQGSDRAVINWHDFSIGAGGRVDIVQPNAGSALLNRVTGGTGSTIAGQINANGQVFLVNPNGILITPTGSVKAAGFVASTLDLSDAQFMNGEINVFGRGGSVTNQGTISIVKGGFAALIGGKVDNSGLILAPLGKVALGAGTRATLDLEGDGFLQVALPARDSGVTMPGRIVANGGAVVISAAQAVDAARSTVNLSGVVEAKGFESRGGTVVLTGDAIALTGASIDVSGTHGGGSVLIGGEAKGQGKLAHAQTLSADVTSSIKADATGIGNGGDIVLWSDQRTGFAGTLSARGAGSGIGGNAEVSSAGLLNYTGIADLRGSHFGTLLLDPYNILISNGADSGGFTATADDSVINASTLQNALTLANVTVSTGTGGTQAGNITVAAPLTWSSGSTLTLDAANAIAINAPITVSGAGGVALNAGSTAVGSARILNLSFGNGASLSYTGTANSGQRLAINGEAYSLLYSMSDLTGAGYANGRYALANDLASTGTYNSAVIPYFSGTLEGLGHHISNLTVVGNNSSAAGGLIGTLNLGGVVRNIGLLGGSVTNQYSFSSGVGGLIGFNRGTVNNAYNTGSVTDGSLGFAGGLIGYNYQGNVSNVYATGSVTVANGFNTMAGGLIGYSVDGTVIDAYATGSVAGSFDGFVGGLIGYANGGTVSNAYATGSVTIPNGSFGGSGGLIGINNNSSVTNAYWDTQTSGQSGSAGGTGLTTAQFQSGAATALGSAFVGGANGLYPYLASFFPNGAQAISGTAYDANSAAAAGAQVGVYANGGLIGGSTISTGANGYYYTIVPAGTLTGATGTGQTVTLSGQTTPGSLQYSDRLALDAYGNISGQTPTSGTFLIDTGRTRWSDLDATFGASAHAALDASLSGLTRQVIATGDFTLDQTLNVDGGLHLQAGGIITVAAPISWATNAAVSLNAASAIAINKSIIASGAGQVALNAASSTVSGFSLLNLTFGNGAGISYTAAPNSGQSLLINGDAYTLLYSMSDLAGLNGSSGRYALATNLNASNAYTTAVIPTFGGTLEGLGHTISNLQITRTADYTALIGTLQNTGTVRDIGLTGASISGGGYAGGLAGYNAGVIVNASVSGSINSSANNAGGLVGYNGAGLIINVYASGSVSGGQNIGGLVGWAQNGTISNAYATSKVSGSSAVGGVVGNNRGALVHAYATGPVSGTGSSQGGLVGSNNGGTVQSSFWDIGTTGRSTSSGGGAGLTTAQLQSGSAAGLGSAFAGGTNGLYPYLASFFPNGVQVISGTAYTGGGVGAANAIINLYSGGSLLAGGTLATAANGYYYTILPVGTLVDRGSIGQTLTLGGTSTVSGVDYRDAVSVDPQGNLLGLSVQSGLINLTTSQTRISDLSAMVQATLGTLTSLDPDMSTRINARGNFSFDTSFGTNSSALDLSVSTAGDLSLLAGVSLTARNISLSAGDNFINLAGASALDAAGRWLVYLPDALGNAYGGLDSQNTAVWATAAGAGISANGNRYVFGESAGTLVMTPLNTSKIYGDTIAPNFAFTITGYRQGVSGAYQGDSSGLSWTGMPTFASTGAAASANAGAYDITMSGLSGANGYNVSFGTGTLTVTPRGLTVTADAISRLYGNANPALTYTLGGDGLVNGDTLSGALATAATATSNVGAYGITQGTLSAGGNYALTFGGADLTVTPRGLSVTADALSRLYGNANPALTYTLGGDGLVNGDTLSGALATAATATSNVGAYGITQGTLSAGGNYALTFTGADLTVTPRGLSVTADAISRLYGNANPALTYALSGDGLVNGDTLSGALATAATTTSNVGTYGITQGTLSAGGNYALTFTGADLTVTPRVLSVTADAISRLYGNANPALTYALGGDGLVNGDTLSGALATAATTTSNVGTYGITQGTLSAGGNYALTFSGADLTVTPRGLSVTADALSRLYGNANPALTYALGGDGLVNGDTLSGALATAATATSNVGAYGITQGTLSAGGNYALTFGGADLTVTPRGLSVTADALSRLYGNANPALTYTLGGDGLVNGDTLSGALATAATTTSNVGAYGITQGTLSAGGNYALTFGGADLTVTPRGLSVTADAISRLYGNANPALTYALGGDGLVNGDTLSGALATAATTTSNVGAYGITQGTLSAGGNYALTFGGADLTVTPRGLSVTADAISRLYGNANPALTYALGGDGLVNGDTLSGALATAATTTSNVGAYGITQGTLSAGGNYALTFGGADLTVTPRGLSVTADALSRLYGNANPALTYTLSGDGLVNGDTLSGALATAATTTSNVGAYGITQGTLSAGGNYALTFGGADLTVTPRGLSVTADAISRLYGNANPALTYTLGGDGLVNGDTLSGALATAATATSNVGAYGITQGTLSAGGNYALTFGGADLTVTPRGLSVTADAISRLYGNANPSLSYSVGGDGLVNGDTLSGALATAATATSNVGAYGITQGTLSAGGNYALTFTGADLTVTPRGLSVTADALSRLYGNANPALTYTLGGDGLVNGDTLSGALATAATTTSNVGAYGITQGTLSAGGNYALTFGGADLTVTPRGLSVTADALSRLYGNANPALTYTLGGDGLVNGDTLSGALATAATATSNVGAYGITQGTLSAGGNYALTFTGADLTVTPRGLSVTADALSRLYGNANPALTYALGGDGLVNGDTLSGALATAATATSNVGAYGITQGTLSAGGNYALTFSGADLTVTPRSPESTAGNLLPYIFTPNLRPVINSVTLLPVAESEPDSSITLVSCQMQGGITCAKR